MNPGDTVVLDGEISLINQIEGELSLNAEYDGEIGEVIVVAEHDLPTYTGPTVITPSEDTQTLMTADKVVTKNIVVNPIPANYGKIVWDGARLRIL